MPRCAQPLRRHHDQLDNTSYGLNAGLDWSTIERLSGSLGVSLNRSLANYATSGDQLQVPQNTKNVETSEQADLAACNTALASLLSLNGVAVAHSAISYSAHRIRATPKCGRTPARWV